MSMGLGESDFAGTGRAGGWAFVGALGGVFGCDLGGSLLAARLGDRGMQRSRESRAKTRSLA
jgi:hypothetical protein